MPLSNHTKHLKWDKNTEYFSKKMYNFSFNLVNCYLFLRACVYVCVCLLLTQGDLIKYIDIDNKKIKKLNAFLFGVHYKQER